MRIIDGTENTLFWEIRTKMLNEHFQRKIDHELCAPDHTKKVSVFKENNYRNNLQSLKLIDSDLFLFIYYLEKHFMKYFRPLWAWNVWSSLINSK